MRTDIATLLTEAAWLTRLARSLVGDPAEAADAVQETWLAAMRSPPDPARPVRPWLRRVLVNTLRMRRRSGRRRDSREAVSELLIEAPPTPEQLVERARVERRLGDLVLALTEPHRSTVLLRYREGHTAEAIAKQQGIPAATVRTRLKTALDQLRDEMDGHEPARKWRALFAPAVVGNSSLWRRLVMAKMATKAGVAIALVLALVLLIGGVLWSRRNVSGGGAAAARVALGGSALPARRAAAGWDPTALFAQAGVPARAIAGRVTLDGKPFAGATVHLADAVTQTTLVEVTSGPDGSFALGTRAAVEYVVIATAPGMTAAIVRVDLRAAIDSSRLELALAGCTSKLVGTVHDASGGVITGARVTREDSPWPVAETDADGHYQLCSPFGYFEIQFAAAGYASRVVGVPVDRNTQRDIALVPEATVAGTVIDSSGHPVPGAWISIEPSGAQPAATGAEHDAAAAGSSAADGTFRIERVAPGSNRIVAFAPGALTASPVGVVAIAGRVIEGVVVRVAPATRMTGIVVAGQTPIVGAAVGVRIGNRDLFGALARTQADGRFAIERLPRGELTVTVSGHSVTAPQSVRIGDTTVDVRVEVTSLGTIAGRVMRAGKPIADAQVHCNYGRINYTRSGRDGRYACGGLPPGRYTLMAAAGDGAWGVFEAALALAAGETKERDIELTFSAEICGRVVDEANRPFSGVEVRIAAPTTDDSASDVTGDDGGFCGRFLEGGSYLITTFTGSQRLEPIKPVAPVTVGRPDGRATVVLAVRRPALAIAGTVSDSAGAPVPDAIVRVVAAERGHAPMFRQALPTTIATTDAAGAFRVEPLSAGQYALVASGRDGSESVLSSVAAGASELAITLDPAGALEGRLVGFTQAPSVLGFLLRGSRGPVRTQIDGDRFRVDGLSPGVYVFTAHTGLGESVAREVTITPGRTTTLDLASPGTGAIAVRLFDFKTKAPLAGMSCMTIGRAGNRVGNMYTPPTQIRRSDAAGRFVIDPAPAGEIYVECSGGGANGIRLISLAPRQRLELDMPIVAASPDRDIGLALDLGHQIEELGPDGPAARAGLILGDKIVTVDGVDVAPLSPSGVMRLIANRPIGAAATLGIERAGQPLAIRLTPVSSGS